MSVEAVKRMALDALDQAVRRDDPNFSAAAAYSECRDLIEILARRAEEAESRCRVLMAPSPNVDPECPF